MDSKKTLRLKSTEQSMTANGKPYVRATFENERGDWKFVTFNTGIMSVSPGSMVDILDAKKGERGWSFNQYQLAGQSGQQSPGAPSAKPASRGNDTGLEASLAGVIKSAIEAGLIKEPGQMEVWVSSARAVLTNTAPANRAPAHRQAQQQAPQYSGYPDPNGADMPGPGFDDDIPF